MVIFQTLNTEALLLGSTSETPFFFKIINKQGRQEGIGHPVSTNLISDSHICFFLLSFRLQL